MPIRAPKRIAHAAGYESNPSSFDGRDMTETIAVRITGTEADLDGFLRSLEYEPDLRVVHSAKYARPRERDRELGQIELLDLVVSFTVSTAGRAAYDQIGKAFKRYSAKRSHMRLEPAEGDVPDSDHATRPDDNRS